MELTEKIALAGRIAVYLDGRSTPLADELTERGFASLAADDDFNRLLNERAFYCPDCEVWSALSEGAEGCSDCGFDDEEDYE